MYVEDTHHAAEQWITNTTSSRGVVANLENGNLTAGRPVSSKKTRMAGAAP